MRNENQSGLNSQASIADDGELVLLETLPNAGQGEARALFQGKWARVFYGDWTRWSEWPGYILYTSGWASQKFRTLEGLRAAIRGGKLERVSWLDSEAPKKYRW